MLPQLQVSVKSFKNGKQTDGFELEEAHSWVRNIYNATCRYLLWPDVSTSAFGDGYINYKSTAGVLTSPAQWNWAGTAGSATGIVVGTGNTAWTFEDFKLATAVAHGNGAGQLSHVLQATGTDAFVGDVCTVTVQRYFNNNSGGDIIIAETGLYVPFLACRDVLVTPVTVEDTGQLLVTYAISADLSP